MSETLNTVLRVVLMGLVGGGVAVLTRALPWGPDWPKRKPLACPACMGGHGAFAAGLFVFESWPGWRVAGVSYFGALMIGAWFYRTLYPPEPDFGLDGGSLGDPR